MNLELSNNLYWDARFSVALGVDTNVVRDASGNPYPIYWKLNAVNKYFKTGSQFPTECSTTRFCGYRAISCTSAATRLSLYPTRSDVELFYCCNDYSSVSDPDDSSGRAQQLPSRHPFPAITHTPTDMLRAVLLNRAGAWPATRWTHVCFNSSRRTPFPPRVPTPTLPTTLCSRPIRVPLQPHLRILMVMACPTRGRSPRV